MAKRNNNRGRKSRDGFRPGDLLQPIEFYRNDQGIPVVVKGVRRVRALRLLAGQGVRGFGLAMSIPAKEVPPPTKTESRGKDQEGL
jgi:hypothetical protein